MTSPVASEQSAQRIRELKERLELFNSALADAAGATAGSGARGSAGKETSGLSTAGRGAATGRDPQARPAAAARTGHTRSTLPFSSEQVGLATPLTSSGLQRGPHSPSNSSSRYTSVDRSAGGSAHYTSRVGATSSAAPAPPPRLERNLAKEFTDTATAGTTPPPREPPRDAAPPPRSAAATHASPPPPTAVGVDAARRGEPTASEDEYEEVEEIVEEEVTADSDSISDSNESGSSLPSSGAIEEATDTDSDSSSTDLGLGLGLGGRAEEEYAMFLRELMEDAELRQSLEATLRGRHLVRAAGASASASAQPATAARHRPRARDAAAAGVASSSSMSSSAADEAAAVTAKGKARFVDAHSAPSSTASPVPPATTVLDAVDALAAVTTATGSSPVKAAAAPAGGSADGPSFDVLEASYYRLCAVMASAEKLEEGLGLDEFPPVLPHGERAAALASRRAELVAADQELQLHPPEGSTLAEIREKFAVPVDGLARESRKERQSTAGEFKVVLERKALVQAKRNLLTQRQRELQERRNTRRTLSDEVAQLSQAVEQGGQQLREREGQYAIRLEEHGRRERNIHERIAEVERLGKKVTSWVRILEERESSLTAKEEKLRRVQTDLLRRSDDLLTFQRVAGRLKQPPPPPPPPPRLSNQ